MKEKETTNREADENQPGLTRTRTQTLYELGTTLGLTKQNIDATLQRRKKILNCLVIAVALTTSVLTYALYARPAHYIGISTQDFNTIGQMMYGAFGRIF